MATALSKSRWGRVKTAVETLWEASTVHVTARLRKALGADPDLLDEARRLLADRVEVGNFMEATATPPDAPSSAQASLPDGLLVANRYLIRRFVGAGAMGEVYEAFDQDVRDTVALKLLRPAWAADGAALTRFRAEIKLNRQVAHGNVCRVHDLRLADVAGIGPVAFLTMEFLRGETLLERLERGPLSAEEAREIAAQVLDGLEAAHAADVLHLDLKCSNILIVPGTQGAGERAVITDFGLARSLSVSPSQTLNNVATGMIAGTPAYMAPEQYGDGPFTKATDIHALGVVLFHMVTGRLPFPAKSALGAAMRRLNERAPSPRVYCKELEPSWEQAIERCLEADADRRPQTVAEVRALLNAPTGRRLWRRRALFLIALAGLGTVAEVVSRTPRRPPAIPPEAQRHLALGNEFLQGRNDDDFKQAMVEFQQAQTLAPRSELPWIGIAEAASSLVNWGLMEPSLGLPTAREAARRALSLNPRSGSAEGILGYVMSIDVHQWLAAEPHFVRAMALDGSNEKVLLWHAAHLSRMGDQAAAIRELNRALAKDPANFLLHEQLATAYFRLRAPTLFLNEARELVRLQPQRGNAHLTLARALEFSGSAGEALQEWAAARKYDTDEEQLLSVRAQIDCGRNDVAAAKAIAGQLEEMSRGRLIEFAGLASIYVRIHDPAKALEALERGYARGDSSVLLAPVLPYLDNIRDLPGFRDFRRKLGLR